LIVTLLIVTFRKSNRYEKELFLQIGIDDNASPF
jgi:hypothetical protein